MRVVYFKTFKTMNKSMLYTIDYVKKVIEKSFCHSGRVIFFLLRPKPHSPLTYIKVQISSKKKIRRYRNWTAKDRARVMFTDKSNICLYANCGQNKAWVKIDDLLPEYAFFKTTKFPAKIMVWLGITVHGPSLISYIESTMGSDVYYEVLDYEVGSVIDAHNMDSSFIYQHDNAACYEASKVTK